MSSQSCTWKPFLWSSAVIYEDDQIQFWRSLTPIPLASVVYPEPSHNVALPARHGQGKGTRSILFFSTARELTLDAQRIVCATRSERGWTDTFRNLHLLERTPCFFRPYNFPSNKQLLKLLSFYLRPWFYLYFEYIWCGNLILLLTK